MGWAGVPEPDPPGAVRKAFQPHARATLQHGHVCACSARRARSRSSPKAPSCSRSAAPPGTSSICRPSIGCGPRRSATRRSRCGCFRRRSTWPTRARARCSSSRATLETPCRSWWRPPIGSISPRRRGRQAGCAVAPRSAASARGPVDHRSGSQRARGARVARRRDRVDPNGRLLLRAPSCVIHRRRTGCSGVVEGARTTAALAASQFGPVSRSARTASSRSSMASGSGISEPVFGQILRRKGGSP